MSFEEWFHDVLTKLAPHYKFNSPEAFTGFVNPNCLEVAEFPYGRGLIYTSNESNDDSKVLLRIPKVLLLGHQKLISLLPSQRSDLIEFVNRELSVYGSLSLLVLLLKFGRVEGSNRLEKMQAFYGSYLDILPASLEGHPLWNDQWQFATHLFPRFVQDHLREESNRRFVQFVKVSKFLALWSIQIPDLESRFKWAWLMVATRCIFIENVAENKGSFEDQRNHIFLCPFFDLFNHCHPLRSNPSAFECTARFESHNQSSYFVLSRKEHQPALYSAGEQAFISYGPHDNWSLLTHYGFAIGSGKYSYSYRICNLDEHVFEADGKALSEPLLSICLEELSDNGSCCQFPPSKRIDLIRELGLQGDYVICEGDDQIPWRLEQTLKILLVRECEFSNEMFLPLIQANQSAWQKHCSLTLKKKQKSSYDSHYEALRLRVQRVFLNHIVKCEEKCQLERLSLLSEITEGLSEELKSSLCLCWGESSRVLKGFIG